MNEQRRRAPVLPATDPENILSVARVLRDGGVAIVPTDTVYGLSASVFHPEAVERIFRLKGRGARQAVPVLLGTAADLPIVARDIPRSAWKLIDRFWPGPLTLVFPASNSLSRTITGGGATVAVRVPGGRTTLLLLEALGEPIVGTSANLHGAGSTFTVAAAIEQVPDVDVALADDSTPHLGLSSTVVEIRDQECMVYREGAVSAERIWAAVGTTMTMHS